MRRGLFAIVAVAVLALAAPAPVVAQDDLAMGQVQSPVLTIDLNRLLAETAFGRQLSAAILTRGETLDAENERIAAELTARERSLTERRPTMDPDAFRAEAEAFDAEVRRIRGEQDTKQRELEAAVGQGRDAFLRAARPVLGDLMRESGAAVIIERSDVFLSASLVDVTDEAIAAIDAAIGDGADRSQAPAEASEDVAPKGGPAQAPASPSQPDPEPPGGG